MFRLIPTLLIAFVFMNLAVALGAKHNAFMFSFYMLWFLLGGISTIIRKENLRVGRLAAIAVIGGVVSHFLEPLVASLFSQHKLNATDMFEGNTSEVRVHYLKTLALWVLVAVEAAMFMPFWAELYRSQAADLRQRLGILFRIKLSENRKEVYCYAAAFSASVVCEMLGAGARLTFPISVSTFVAVTLVLRNSAAVRPRTWVNFCAAAAQVYIAAPINAVNAEKIEQLRIMLVEKQISLTEYLERIGPLHIPVGINILCLVAFFGYWGNRGLARPKLNPEPSLRAHSA